MHQGSKLDTNNTKSGSFVSVNGGQTNNFALNFYITLSSAVPDYRYETISPLFLEVTFVRIWSQKAGRNKTDISFWRIVIFLDAGTRGGSIEPPGIEVVCIGDRSSLWI